VDYRFGIALAAVAALAAPARAQTIRLSGLLSARGIYVRSRPSWLAGGFGRLDFGSRTATSSTTTHQEVAQLGLDWTPSTWFDAHVSGVARDEPQTTGGRRGGLVEAFVDFRKDFGSRQLQLRAGQFFLPTSRENTEAFWTSPYTISFSALNAWIGQEFRPLGAELEWKTFAGSNLFTVAGGTFQRNDTMGALLGWRGWSIGNRLSVYGEVLPLPPLFSLRDPRGFHDQRSDGTRPFGPDLDGRVGFTARARLSRPERGLIQFAHVDNRGDRSEYRGEYAWQTHFNIAGGEISNDAGTTVAAEYGWGATGMGFPPEASVDLRFYAGYVLLSQKVGRNRLSARMEAFGTADRDHSPFVETNSESGRAWTLAWFFEPRPSVRFGVEFANVSAQRMAAAESGFDANTDGRTVIVDGRWKF
jgi:hypothetical protein